MTEREALLHAVLKDTRDRTPLLVYADWLLERAGELPAAGATAEFIHLACSGKSLRRMTSPQVCQRWLSENWTRLIPSVAAMAKPILHSPDGFLDAGHKHPDSAEKPFGWGAQVTNAAIDTLVGVAGVTQTGEKVYPCRIKFKVGFGLLVRAEMKSDFGKKRVWPLLSKDQPQLTMDFHWAERLQQDVFNKLEAPIKDDRTLADLLGDE